MTAAANPATSLNGIQMVDADITLRDRIAAVLQAEDERWHGDPFTQPPASYDSLADAVIAELGLRMQYENGRVMYDYKPAACKANGNWKQRIVSDHELYTG